MRCNTQLFTSFCRCLHGRVSYQPKHLLLIRRLYSRACKPDEDTLSSLSQYGLLHYRGKRAGTKGITHRSFSIHSTPSSQLYGNNVAVVIGNRPRPPGTRRHCSGLGDLRGVRTLIELTKSTPASPAIQNGQLSPPTLYVFNARSIAKPHAIEQLTAEMIGYDVGVGVISESHLKKKHADSSVSIDGYDLFRRDRPGRKGGGVAIYVRNSSISSVWSCPGQNNPLLELLWVKVVRDSDVTFIGALYHPPAPIYATADLLGVVESTVLSILREFPDAHVVLAGDLNMLPEIEIVARTGLSPIVFQPTRGNNQLDRIYVSDQQYTSVKVVKSTVESDHLAIVASAVGAVKSMNKTRRVCTFTKHSASQHAHFLASVREPVHQVNPNGDPQEECDHLYATLAELLNTYYPPCTVTLTSADPPYITPTVKCMLRHKNHLMRTGRTEKAAALAVKIGAAIKSYNSAELCKVDMLSDSKSVWDKVHMLTGRTKSINTTCQRNPGITAATLNMHYASISSDANYTAPSIKSTVNNELAGSMISDWRVFQILDTLHHTATGIDGIPSWFLRIGAPFFAAPVADMMNLSLSSSVVPTQWKKASILPIAKVHPPSTLSDYRPISITPVLSRMLERIVVKDYIYPSFQSPPSGLSFTDQFAFQPTGSTTCALIQLFHIISTLLESNQYVIVFALDFSKAFDSVRHSAVLDKFSKLLIPDNIYNWIESFFRGHSHCTKFGHDSSNFQEIMASIIQGSCIGPASYVVTASDLHAVTQGNAMAKYADDTYLVVPASNFSSCATEILNVEQWAANNNLSLNRSKSSEIVFVAPRSRRESALPPQNTFGFKRTDSIKALGVSFTRKLSVTPHIDELLATCARTLFALRTLRQHGLPDVIIHDIFQATVVAKLTYASQAWWGYANAADRARLESFMRRCVRLGFRSANSTTLASICDKADVRLFKNISNNSHHLLRYLLPPTKNEHYSLRNRSHNYQLPTKSSTLTDNGFIKRMLFKNIGCLSNSLQ